MKNEKQINEICRKESKVLAVKEWLCVLFFLAAIVTAVIYLKALSNAVDPLLGIEADQTAVKTIIITFSVFAVSVIAGYFYNKFLSKELNRLWEQKQLLF